MSNTIQQQVLDTFHHIHENGEISWEETKTTEYIKNILEANGCETITFDDCTGVIGEYGDFSKGLPVVAIRADIDALWQEIDGVFQPNHSCGHDAHTAMVLGVLWKLNEDPSLKDKVAIKFVFQPAEEVGEGALKLVEKGVIDDVDYFYGIHLRPGTETALGNATPVIVHGATRVIQLKLTGDDAHGGRPHLNTSAIEVGASLVQLINNIQLDPTIPHSAKVTKFVAGGKNANIIPGNATFSLDIRAQTNELMEQLSSEIHHIIDTLRDMYKADIEITKENGIVAAETDEEAIDIMSDAIRNALGEEHLDKPLLTPGGDDFHYYKVNLPHIKGTMVGLGCALGPGLHHPKMTFDHSALMNGVHILYEAVLETYKRSEK